MVMNPYVMAKTGQMVPMSSPGPGGNAGTFNMARPPLSPLEQLRMAISMSTSPELAMNFKPTASSSASPVAKQVNAMMRPRAQAPAAAPPVDNSGKAAEAAEVTDLNKLIRAMLEPRSKDQKSNDFLSSMFANMAGGSDPTFLGSLGKGVSGAYAKGQELDKEQRGEGKDALKMMMGMQELSDNRGYRSGVLKNQERELELKARAIDMDYKVGMARVAAVGDRNSMLAYRATKAQLDGLLKQEKELAKSAMLDPQAAGMLNQVRQAILMKHQQLNEIGGHDEEMSVTGIGGSQSPIEVDMNSPDFGASQYMMNPAASAQGQVNFNGGIGTIVP